MSAEVRCPKCSCPLDSVQLPERVTVESCPHCYGAFFDLAELAAFVRARLPAYQRLYFVRLSRDLAVPGTFKHQKVDYRSQGYDPARSGDPLYYLDEKTSAYIRIDHELHERLRRAEIGPR